MHDYAIDDQVYVEITGIYHKLDYKKQGPNIIKDYLQMVQFESNGDK